MDVSRDIEVIQQAFRGNQCSPGTPYMNGWMRVYTVTGGEYLASGHTVYEARDYISRTRKKLCLVSARDDGGFTVILAPVSILFLKATKIAKTGLITGVTLVTNFIAWNIFLTLLRRHVFDS